MVVEGTDDGINVTFSSPDKKFSNIFSKRNRNFYLSLYCIADKSYLLINGIEILDFKAEDKNVYFSNQFLLESISNRFSITESIGEMSMIFQSITISLLNKTY